MGSWLVLKRVECNPRHVTPPPPCHTSQHYATLPLVLHAPKRPWTISPGTCLISGFACGVLPRSMRTKANSLCCHCHCRPLTAPGTTPHQRMAGDPQAPHAPSGSVSVGLRMVGEGGHGSIFGRGPASRSGLFVFVPSEAFLQAKLQSS